MDLTQNILSFALLMAVLGLILKADAKEIFFYSAKMMSFIQWTAHSYQKVRTDVPSIMGWVGMIVSVWQCVWGENAVVTVVGGIADSVVMERNVRMENAFPVHRNVLARNADQMDVTRHAGPVPKERRAIFMASV